ncbi:MAG: UDP-3-O-(3-hydroxymyristoyl)glucosamine N-acyltransferase [Desulfobacula sp.]|nr:UDP-3-O-(3-hydroxymyristoyl)glucosamine N-acyltransferase [Desulfobacula sp.]
MKISIEEIAKIIQAQIVGDASICISGVNSIEEATSLDITFAIDNRFLKQIETSCAGAIIIPDSMELNKAIETQSVFLKTRDPKRSFFDLVSLFHPLLKPATGIHPGAVLGHDVIVGKDIVIEAGVTIGNGVCIGDMVHIMPNVFVGSETKIGSHTTIKPNVTIMERTRIGSDVLIHSGSVIGSDGFGFTQSSGMHEKIIHTGFVQIGDHVEIGACNTIDRGTLGKTHIGNGVKTDNLVHIAHNVKVGDNTLIVAQVGIAGSAQLGSNVIVAGKAGISGHIKIGDNAIIGPYAGVHSNVEQGKIVSGIPQMPHGRWRKVVSIISRLPEMRKKLFSIEKRLKELENKKE